MSWDLQSDDDERLFSLGLKAVTRFPSLSSLFESIHFPFFSISCLVLRIRYGVVSRLNHNHALDFGDPAHNYARLERAKRSDYFFCFRQHAVDFHIGISSLNHESNGLV